MKIPKTYRLQNGCCNCKYCFEYTEYDCPYSYYCCLDGEERPLSLSVAMGECPTLKTRKFGALQKKWLEWENNREILPWGICNEYERKEEER